jgi:hypothetical protein
VSIRIHALDELQVSFSLGVARIDRHSEILQEGAEVGIQVVTRRVRRRCLRNEFAGVIE